MEFISPILSALRQLPFDIPSWVWASLAILIAVIILYIALSRIYLAIRRLMPKKSALPAKKSAPVTLSTATPEEPSESAPRRSRWFRRNHNQFFPLFKKLSADLHEQISERHFRYEIPWIQKNYRNKIPLILQMGEELSGKSTLLHDTGLDMPFGIPQTTDVGCDAWFFAKGVVFDLAGKYVLNAQAGSDKVGWRDFLYNLQRFRPQRPLDAVILSIAADELLARETQPDIVKNKAEHLYQKLRDMQNVLGMRLPVYILITRCDQMSGFNAFAQALPERLHNNLFGWSNPYSVETTYNEELVEHIFQTLYHAINELQLELITANQDIPEQDIFLSFPHQFRPLLQQLKIYLNSIFRASIYHEPFFLRGVYCCGNGLENIPDYQHQDALSDDIHFKPKIQEKNHRQHILFLHHLFRDKIFVEQTLARPVRSILQRRNIQVWITRVAFVVVGALLFSWQWYTYDQLKQQKDDEILPILREISDHQIERKNAEDESELKRAKLAEQSARSLLNSVIRIQAESFRVLLLPLSWGGGLDTQIEEALAVAYQDFIADWLHDGLNKKMHQIKEGLQYQRTTVSIKAYERIDKTPEYRELNDYLVSLNKFQTHVNLYNNLQETNNTSNMLTSIEDIANYAYKTKELQDTRTGIYSEGKNTLASGALEIVAERSFKHFDENPARPALQKETAALLHTWLQEFFSHSLLLKELERINNVLTQSQANSSGTLESWQKFEEAVQRIDKMSKNEQWHWVKAQHIREIPEVKSMFSTIKEMSLLDTEFAKTQETKANEQFQDFRQKLEHQLAELRRLGVAPATATTEQEPRSSETPLAINSIATMTNSAETASPAGSPSIAANTVAVNPQNNIATQPAVSQANAATATTTNLSNTQKQQGLAAFKHDMDLLDREPFMEKIGSPQELKPILINNILFWRIPKLQEAYELTQSYQKFIDETLPNMPSASRPHLQDSLRKSSSVRMVENLRTLIAQAQDMRVQSFETALQEEMLGTYSQNFQKAVPELKKLLQFIQTALPNAHAQSLRRAVHQLVNATAYDLLRRADVLLSTEKLYEPVGLNLQVWDGQSSLAQQVFNVGDHEELEYLLRLMSKRIIYLSQNYADVAQQYLYESPGKAINAQSLVPKWRNIKQALSAYETKKPDNTLNILEKFILFELDKVTLDNCFNDEDNPLLVARPHAKQDYFVRKQNELKQHVFQRCVELAKETSFKHYTTIAGFFNQRLAERFPFLSITPDDAEFAIVEPMQIQDFYGIYQLYQKHLRNKIDNTPSFGAARHRSAQFLDQIAFAQPFFQDMLGSKPALQQPAYNFQVEFRVNRKHEKWANQIIDWELRVADTPIKNVKGEWRGHWQYGQSISLKLRWARNSAYRPYWNGSPAAEIFALNNETEAVFTYQTDWALLEMLTRHRPSEKDINASKYRVEELAKFTIPVIQLVEALTLEQAAKQVDMPKQVDKSTPKQTDKAPQEILLMESSSKASSRLSHLPNNKLHRVPTKSVEQLTTDASIDSTIKQPSIVLYQDKYRSLFELPDTAVVFMQVKLSLATDPKQGVTLTALPDNAPRIKFDAANTQYLPPNQSLKPVPYQSPLPVALNEKTEENAEKEKTKP